MASTPLELDDARKQAADAEESRRRVGLFLRMAVHDIRGPLASILGFAELLSSPELDETVRSECVGHILKAGRALEHLSNDLLDFGRLETDAMGIRAQPVDLRELLADCLDDLDARAEGLSERVEVDVDESVPDRVEVDGARLRQVIGILFERALGAPGGAGAPPGPVIAAASVRDARLRIRVSDPGPRPADEVVNRIFEDTGTRPDPSGLRPGEPPFRLYLARGIAHAMGGALDLAAPETGRSGTVFLLSVAIPGENA